MRLVLARKLTMHLLLHCLAEVPLALCSRRVPRASRAETWVVDGRTCGREPAGIGMYVFRRVLALRAEDSRRRIVVVTDVSASVEMAELASRGCVVRVYGHRVARSIALWGYLRYVRQVVRAERAGVFWQPNNVQPCVLPGVPRVIVTVHDAVGLAKWRVRKALWHLYYRFAFARTLRVATELEYVSTVAKTCVEAAMPRARRLPSRLRPPIIQVPPRETIGSWGRPKTFFLFLGTRERRKGADLLLKAFNRYRVAGGRGTLIMAGRAGDVDVPSRVGVEVLGYVDAKTKFALMCSCCKMVVPSRDEGYGMHVAEAAALGVPVVAADLPSFSAIEATGREVLTGFSAASDTRRVEMLLDALLKTTILDSSADPPFHGVL